MNRLSVAFIAGVSTIVLTGGASAADMPVKAPAPVFAPAYNWTGFYVGASVGYGWTSNDVTLAGTGTPIPSGNPGFPAFVSAAASASSMTLNPDPGGFIGGGQLGYNHQIGQWVWGLEADFSGAGIKGSETKVQVVSSVSIPSVSAKITGTAEQKLNFFGTVRGRLGFTPVNSVLIYATGGFAYGRVESSTNTSDAPIACGLFANPCTTGPASGSASAWRGGWTVGGGVESMLAFAPRWSIKAEYLYYDLGNLTYALSPAATTVNGTTTFGHVNTTAIADFQGHIARIGANYHF
jgi:outer membrane immunogenic protein